MRLAHAVPLGGLILLGCATIDTNDPDYVFYRQCNSSWPGSLSHGRVSERDRICMDRLKIQEQERQQARARQQTELQAIQERRATEAEEGAKRVQEYAKRRAARPKGYCPDTLAPDEAEIELTPRMLPFPPGWVAVQQLEGFVIYDNPSGFVEVPGLLQSNRYLVAVTGIRTKVQRGEALVSHVPYLCELGERVSEDDRGFPITVRLYKVIYERTPACPDGLAVPGRSCVDGEVLSGRN